MKDILLVGAGNLGSRHLQGVAKLCEPVNVTVVEPNAKARVLAMKRWAEVPSSNLHSLRFCALADVDRSFDAAIVATLSVGRLDIIRYLLKWRIPHILCEKMAFQSVELYQQVMDLLASTSSQIYLNYIYRLSEPINQLRQSLQHKRIQLDISSGNVELGCNLIHYVDLGSYLNGGVPVTGLEMQDIHIVDYNPRHPQLKSFYGLVRGSYANGATLNASLLDRAGVDYKLTLSHQQQQYVVNESVGKITSADGTVSDFAPPRVSDTTTEVLTGLMKGHSVLPTLAESFVANKMILDGLNQCLYGATDPSLLCPIT